MPWIDSGDSSYWQADPVTATAAPPPLQQTIAGNTIIGSNDPNVVSGASTMPTAPPVPTNSAFDWNSNPAISGYNWNFSNQGSYAPQQMNQDYWNSIGFNGVANPSQYGADYAGNIGSTDMSALQSPELNQWIQQQGLRFGYGMNSDNHAAKGYFNSQGQLQGTPQSINLNDNIGMVLGALGIGGFGALAAGAGVGAGGATAGALGGGDAALAAVDAAAAGATPAVTASMPGFASGIPISTAGEAGAGLDAMGGAAGTLGAADSQAANLALGLGANAGAVPAAVDLGSLGGTMSTGAGAASSGLSSIFNQAADSQAANAAMRAATAPTGQEVSSAVGNPAIPTGTGTGTPSLTGAGSTLSNLLGGGTLGNLAGGAVNSALSPQGLASLLSIYNNQQNQATWQKQMDELNKNFATDSPFAQQMQQTLAAKDAAAGRNSQYGPRAAQLAGNLATAKANAVKDMITLQQNANNAGNSTFSDIAGLLGSSGGQNSLLAQLGSGLNSGFNDLLKLFGS